MEKILISGGKRLEGEVHISGAKNALLPIMPACILHPGKYILHNVPMLRDTRTMLELLELVGLRFQIDGNTLHVDSSACNKAVAPYELVKTMRASFYVLGPFLGRFHEAEVALPGGCAWGPRPVDYHLKAMEQMGAKISLESGNIVAKGKLQGAEILFEQQSVGATGNVLMAAVLADGQTRIKNSALEPEISALADFLSKMGGKIQQESGEYIIDGVEKLQADFEYSIIPDRIEAGTYMIAAAITGGDVILRDVIPAHLTALTKVLEKMGAEISEGDDWLQVKMTDRPQAVDVITEPYPGFPTDLQAQIVAFASIASGKSTVEEGVYHDRFSHIPELNRFGANLKVEGKAVQIDGVESLVAAPVMSTDIRASASLVLAALAAKGESAISRIYHLDRGYENIVRKFRKLGAEIRRSSV